MSLCSRILFRLWFYAAVWTTLQKEEGNGGKLEREICVYVYSTYTCVYVEEKGIYYKKQIKFVNCFNC